MSLEDKLTAAFIDSYHVSGKEVGYWAKRFLQAVKKTGGLATTRRMLKQRSADQRTGLDTLLEANRPELTVESIVLQRRFRSLFTTIEIAAAQGRLNEYGEQIAAKLAAFCFVVEFF